MERTEHPSLNTLEEDLLETSARITHRNITLLQIDMASKESLILQKTVSQTQEYLTQRPHLHTKERQALEEAAVNFARKQVGELREHTYLLIAALQMERERRDADIRTFCQKPHIDFPYGGVLQ